MIEIVDIDHGQELDAFVRQHTKSHFMQTTLWGRVKTDWGWHGLILRDDAGNIKGTMALLEHKIRKLSTSLLYAPRGPIFDEGDFDTFRVLIEAGKTYAKKLGSYLLRVDPMVPYEDEEFLAKAKSIGLHCDQASDFSLFQPRMCYVLDLEELTKETIATNYHRSTRYKINRSLRSDMTIRLGTCEDLPRFCEMMAQVGKKNDFEPRSEKYFKEFLTGLGEYAKLFLAEKDGKTIAASVMVYLSNRAWFMYGCSDQEALDDHPNERLQWEMQCMAKDLGCRWFDFRGVEGLPDPENPKYGLHRYKMGFGADFRSYIGQLDLTVRPLTAWAVNVAQKLLK